jgi:hypothetical protein
VPAFGQDAGDAGGWAAGFTADQFSQRIRAIGRLLFQHTGNHLANRCLCRRTAERHVAAKKLPDINVGQDDEDIEKLFARGALRALELRREHSLHALAVIVSALFEGRLQPGVAALVIEPLHDEIANAFVNVEERSDRRLDVAGRRGFQKHAAGRHVGKRGVDQFVLARIGAQDGAHGDAGARGDLFQREVLDRALAIKRDGRKPNAGLGRVGLWPRMPLA